MSAAGLSPQAQLDDARLRANARAWRTHTQRPLFAVIKSDGYGFGLGRVARAVEPESDGFCVADVSEFRALRAITDKPIRLFAEPSAADLPAILLHGGRPAICTPAHLAKCVEIAEAQQRIVQVCLGLSPAVGWFGAAPADWSQLREIARSPWLEIELWSHLTQPAAYAAEQQAFTEFCEFFADPEVTVTSRDFESTAPLSHRRAQGDSARIGIGLFGAYSTQIPGLRCAVSLQARLVEQKASHADLAIGYRRLPAPAEGKLRVLRLGYGDGFTRQLVGAQTASGTILNIGMQYTVVHAQDATAPSAMVTLIDETTDLAKLCEASAATPHDVVAGLGLSARRDVTR